MLKKLVCGGTLWDSPIFEPVIRSNGDNSNGRDAANLHSLSHLELERNFSHITSIPSRNKTFLRLWQQDPGFDLILGRFAASFSRFPRLFNLSSLKTGVVSCFLALSFCRNLRDPEVVELSSLLVLHNSHLSLSCLDSSLWSLSSSGIFSVSSFFSSLSVPPSSVSFPTKRFGFPLSLLKSKLFFGAWSRA